MLTTLLRTLLPASLLALSAASTTPPPASPRPVVLLVHGRGQAARDTAELRRELRQALQAGTRTLTGDTLVGDDDVRLVWYADAVDPRDHGDAACAVPPAREGVAEAVPRDLLAVVAAAADAMLDVVGIPATADERELRAVVADLRYLGEPAARCAAEQRLGAALERARSERRPVVLVAHSFGAIVSWGHLTRSAPGARSPVRVERFVTVGSPLASRDVRQVVFGDAAPLAPPPGVVSWVNVVDDGDPLAVPLADADSLALPAAMTDVRAASPRADSHDFALYLRDVATARAVTGAWCAAFGAAAPAGCARTRDP